MTTERITNTFNQMKSNISNFVDAKASLEFNEIEQRFIGGENVSE